MNTASWYPLHLSSTLPHSTSPSPFLALSYFCEDFPCITYPYLIDSRGQNDFHLGNSGRQNHCIPPRRGPKCPRCYFSVSLNCSTHYYSSKSIPTSEFQWQQKQYSEENGSVQCSSSINQSPQQRGWWCKLTYRGHAKHQQNSGWLWGNDVLITNWQESTIWLLLSLWERNLKLTNKNGTFHIDFTGLGDLQHIF